MCCGLENGAREVCRKGGGPGASDLFGPSAGQSVGAHHGGKSWALTIAGEEKSGKKKDPKTGSGHAQSWRATRTARLLQRFWSSASDKTTPCCFLQRGRDGKMQDANLRVVSRRSPCSGSCR